MAIFEPRLILSSTCVFGFYMKPCSLNFCSQMNPSMLNVKRGYLKNMHFESDCDITSVGECTKKEIIETAQVSKKWRNES